MQNATRLKIGTINLLTAIDEPREASGGERCAIKMTKRLIFDVFLASQSYERVLRTLYIDIDSNSALLVSRINETALTKPFEKSRALLRSFNTVLQ